MMCFSSFYYLDPSVSIYFKKTTNEFEEEKKAQSTILNLQLGLGLAIIGYPKIPYYTGILAYSIVFNLRKPCQLKLKAVFILCSVVFQRLRNPSC